ncbi:DUF2142 domain-containing protein [Streptococcus plurextorum]
MRIETVYLLLSFIFIGASIILMPINAVPDEMNHARMSWGLLFHEDYGMDWFNAAPNTTFHDLSLFQTKVDLSREVFSPHIKLSMLGHLPQLLGMLLGMLVSNTVGVMVIGGRIVNALVYIFGMHAIIKRVKSGKEVIFFISLLPIMVQQAGSLSYDVMNFLTIMVFFHHFINLIHGRYFGWRELFKTAMILLFIIAGGKKNNLLLLGLLPFIDFDFILTDGLTKWAKASRTFFKKHRMTIILTSIALGILAMLAIIFVLNVDVVKYARVLINTLFRNGKNGHLNTILTIGMFGYIGNFEEQLPLWLIYIDIVFLTLLFIEDSKMFFSRKIGFISGLVFPVQVLIVVMGMYLAWTPIVLGDGADISVGAQGRYFTPFLIFFYPLMQSFRDKLGTVYNSEVLRRSMYLLLTINFVISGILTYIAYIG